MSKFLVVLISLLFGVLFSGCSNIRDYKRCDRIKVHDALLELSAEYRTLKSWKENRAILSGYSASFILDVICNDIEESVYLRIEGMKYVAERDFHAYSKALPVFLENSSPTVRGIALAVIDQNDVSPRDLAIVEKMLDDTSIVVRLEAARILLFNDPNNKKLLDMVISQLATEDGWDDNIGDPPHFLWEIAKLTLDELLRQKKISPEYLFLKAKEYEKVNRTIYYHLIDVCTYVPSSPDFFETYIDFNDKKRLADLDEIFEEKIKEIIQ